MTITTYSDRRRQQVERASQEWRSALIDVSGSNRLLFFKPTASTLNLANANPAAVAELLAGSTVRLSRLFDDPIKFVAAQRACKSLAAKQREAREEYGIAVAFCALGIATWARNPDDVISRSQDESMSRGPAAPVLLRAVELTSQPGSPNSWELMLSGDAQLNPVLVHVLAAQKVRLEEEEILEAGDDTSGEFSPIFDFMRKACSEVAGFEIDEQMLLGPFSYLKQPMVADCEDIEALLSSDIVSALAGDDEAVGDIRTLLGEVSEVDPDYKPVESEFLVLDADASQSYVVNAALAGRNLVVQGPPGTGKSQTIANVIAGLVANGKTVLFVAQKRAAVTAVLDRLEAVGLDEITLDLFAAGASRRYVAEELHKVLESQSMIGAPVTQALHRTLTGARDRLVRHRDALHTRKHAWGVTVAELLVLASTGSSAAASKLRLPTETLTNWGPDDLEIFAQNLGELSEKGGLDPARLSRAGWSEQALVTSEAVAAANQVLISLNSFLVPSAIEALNVVCAELGISAPVEPTQVRQLFLDLAEGATLSQVIPGAFDSALDASGLGRLLAATDRGYRKSAGIKLGLRERRRARKEAQATVTAGSTPADAKLHRLLLRAKVIREAWSNWGGNGEVRCITSLAEVQKAFVDLERQLAALQPYLQNIDLITLKLIDLSETLTDLAADQRRAQFPRLHELEATLNVGGLSQVLAALRRPVEPGQVVVCGNAVIATDMLRHIAVHSVLDQVLTTDPELAEIRGSELTSSAETFQRFDDDHLMANAARIRRISAVRLTQALNENTDQYLLLKREVTKRQNFTPIRRLFDAAPEVMTAIKPCWAMSPLQVSRLLPATACFDVVIFDEASQVKPADAIPALIRAPQAIVAGDSRQLPPTEFFTKVLEDVPSSPVSGRSAAAMEQEALAAEADAEDVDLTDADESVVIQPARPPGETNTKDAESILFAFDRILAGQSRRLLWHYRSRDERLIAVSNACVYDWSLTTFPAADGGDCVHHDVVPPSSGIKGGSNSPSAEVERVVELVLEHARVHPDETLGVITFGIPHTRRILAALETTFAEEPELEKVLHSNEREPFFVKNIERVQGDERDAIILTFGYGKGVDGKLRLFWGPLLEPGGERRLNVAISRARARMTLVTSFAADDVAEDTHHSAGFALMYRFIRFMASKGTELTGDGLTGTPLNAFEIDIRDRLREAGLDLVSQLGVGKYRLDFAARHPDHPGRYVLAIEADGASYHAGLVARERDRLRQRQLESRGWTFHRIWSTDWFNNASYEIQRAVQAVEVAVRASGDAQRGPDEARETEEVAESDWHIATAERTLACPVFAKGLGIDLYDHDLLVELIKYIRSDDLLRPHDDELLIVMHELGFKKRGTKIVRRIKAAQFQVDKSL